MSHSLVLYHFDSCPFCAKVRHFMDENHLKIEMKDIQKKPSDRETLKKLGGKTQVPCLVIDGTALYESTDIITWLKENAL